MSLRFDTINLAAHRELCITFRCDAAVCSFGHDRDITEVPGGTQSYIAWLERLLVKVPEGQVHAKDEELIVGQIELNVIKEDNRKMGFVHLYYLIPSMRGKGHGRACDNFAMDFFKRRGLGEARLRVAQMNAPARGFYKALGWIETGPSDQDPQLLVLKKKIL